ncbi:MULTISPECIES: hypothetical protein [Staphylococcus]|uniref:hypothetical protein n=1 Tax=Staphylococcus TaxID=1279 RepID=UPI00076B86EE|nr:MULTISPECIES: hypothetical protein [Staphylococcus]AMG64685.1 hypothetical protein AL501_10690 [Staphylococcus lugdunensis]MCH8657748.1 hypothetical protein [Staphylococcus lugdunensis]MCH8668188.1 hypothetical protein [Staphylococcus lugdunensis]MCI2813855.1 hypothetical protein [Staphylococcus lugdunensis]MDU0965656.1 hypothetical protein [Staphylococcus lugdunensis]
MKVVYLWKNGQQVLVYQNEEGEYVYPEEKYTEEQPPQGIYAPFYYDGQKWVGQSKEDFENTLKKDDVTVDEKDTLIADLTIQVAGMNSKLEENNAVVSNLMLQVAQLQGGH